MSFGETRRKILRVIDFPMSIGDVRIAAGIKYDTAKEHLDWFFSMGILHSSRDPNSGKLLFHKAEFAHPSMLYHLSMQEIEKKKQEGLIPEDAKREDAELAEYQLRQPKYGDVEQLEDAPARKYPGEEEEFESVIEEEKHD